MVIGAHILFMAGFGLMISPLMTESLALQQVAGAFGTAVLVTVATLGPGGESGVPDAAGLRTAFVVAGCIGVLTVITALFIRRRGTSRSTS